MIIYSSLTEPGVSLSPQPMSKNSGETTSSSETQGKTVTTRP